MEWRERAISAGARPTPEIDRFYFKSIYFREPSGVLFEIATLGPGFTVDEPLEHLGEKLSLPPDFEHLRAEVEPNLRPVVEPARRVTERVSGDFVWRDAGRTVVFRAAGVGAGAAAARRARLRPFELLSTPRALAGAAELAAAADRRARGRARPGARTAAGAARRGRGRERLVALGGGRVIDTAKALASVTGARVAAIPTTMSGAEMTGIHRLPAGAESRVAAHGPPELVDRRPGGDDRPARGLLRASAMNALAHGADSLYTPFANPVSRDGGAARRRADRRLARPRAGGRDRAPLALGSLLCGYAIDSGMFGLHHVICQTLVRVCGSPTPRPTRRSCRGRWRFWPPGAGRLAGLAAAIGTDARGSKSGSSSSAATRRPRRDRRRRAPGSTRHSTRCSTVPSSAFVPGPPTGAELAELVESAW